MDSELIFRYTYAVVIVQFVIGLFGVATNWPIVYITIKNKKLRHLPCHLLAAIAVCDTIYGFGGVVPMVTMSFAFQITLRTCFILESHSPFAVSVAVPLILFLGLERLLAVVFPIWYQKIAKNRKLTHLCLILVVSFGYGAFIMCNFYKIVLQSPENLVFCQPSDFIHGQAATISYNCQLVFTICTIIMYLVVWTAIKFKKSDLRTNRLIMKSLLVIIGVLLICWLFTGIFGLVVPSLPMGAEEKYLWNRIVIQLNRLASTLNGPILYICSAEYRKIFKTEFRHLLCGKVQQAQQVAGQNASTLPNCNQQQLNQIAPLQCNNFIPINSTSM